MTDLVARLKLEASAGNAAQVIGAAERAVEGLGRAGQQASTGLDRTRASADRLDRELAETSARAAAAGRGLSSAAGGARQFERSAGMASGAGRLLGATLAALGARELIRTISDAAMSTQGWATGLGVVTGGAANAQAATAFLRQESERLGLVVRDQTNSFVGLAGSTNGTALAGAQTREIWLGLVEAGTALNRSNEQQQRAMEAVAQIASKGTVAMEELRGQLAEAIPGATQIAARAMNMTTGELMKLVAAGKLASEDFLPKFAAQLRKEFGGALDEAMTSPLGRARKELAATQNALFDLEAAAGASFLEGVTEGITGLNAALTDPEARAAARQIGKELGEAFGTTARFVGGLVENVDAVTAAAKGLVVIGLSAWLGTAASAAILTAREMFALAGATTATAQASVLAKAGSEGLAKVLGGPLGIGLAIVTGGLMALADAERSANAAILDSSKALKESQTSAADALQRAVEYSDKYGLSTSSLSDALDKVVLAGDSAAGAAITKAGADDDAARAAIRRAQAERLLTLELLNQAAARARTQGDKLVGSANTLGIFNRAARFGLKFDPTLTGEEQEFGYRAVAERDARRTQGYKSAASQYQLASVLSQQSAALKPAPIVVAPAAVVHDTTTDAAGKRAKKTDEVREAERRLAAAGDVARQAALDTLALKERADAAGKGAAALEELRIKQAGLEVLDRMAVKSLDALTGAQRKAAEAAIAAAVARERQAVATEKAEAVARTTEDLDRQITAEKGYAAAIAGGEKALVDYTVAEAVRQEVERTGKTLSDDQVAAIRQRVIELQRLKAATESVSDQKVLAQENLLARMTTQEREREVRVIELRNRYLREGTAATEAEADARARIVASYEQETRRRADDVGKLKTQLRDAYIESGKLGFDQVADYAQKRLREAVYDALLAKPIDIVINAAVNYTGQIAGKILGLPGLGGGAAGGGNILGPIGSLFGGGGASAGGLGSIFGSGFSLSGIASGIGSLFGGGGAAAAGLSAGASIAGIGSGIAGVGAGLASAGAAGAAGAAGGLLGGASGLLGLLGPIGAIAGLVALVAPMFGNGPSNNGAVATFNGGGFTVGGSKRTAQTTDAVSGAAKSVLGVIDTLKALGIDGSGVIKALDVGVRDPSKIRLNDGTTIKTAKGDMEALVKAAATALLKDGVYKDPQMEKVVDQLLAANKSFDEIATKLGEYVQAQKVGDDLKLELLRYTDPNSYALKSLEASQKARRDQIDAYAADGFYSDSQLVGIKATLAALDNAELVDAMERLGQGTIGAAKALKDARPRLQDWLDGLGYTAAAQLNPFEERQLAMAQYERMLEKARAGDATALAGITGAGDRLIGTDQAATSSAQDRLALFNKVQTDIAGLVALAAPVITTALAAIGGGTTAAGVSPVVAATQAGTAQLETLTAEVVGLRTDLVAALDRLGGDLGETYADVGNGLAELLERIRETGGSTLDALNEMARDGRLNGALLAASTARIGQ